MRKSSFYFIFLIILVGCHKPSPLYSQTAYVFGTKVDISIWGANAQQAKTHIAAILQEFDRMQQRLHSWQKSDLTTLNVGFANSQASSIDQEMWQWLQNAREYEMRTDHLFNPATGQLIAAWGFHHDTFAAHVPSMAIVEKWRQAKPSLNNLTLTANKVKSRNRAVFIDVGGIAKGWALDYAAAYLRQHQISNALINIGGNVLVLGRKDKQRWTVGLQDPRAPEPMAIIALNDGESIGTSGDYQRYFMFEGKRYSHLIDPRTGFPAQGITSATVIVPAGREAGTLSDIVTKPLFIGGIATAPVYLQRFAIQDALIINSEGNAYITPSMQARIQWLRKPPHICLLY